MFVLHHVTFSINSLCHTFGRRRFATDDESRNLAWLALPSMGEAWHNNHHAFPTSYRHGLRAWEIDPSALVIRALEATRLAWDVTVITRDRQERRYGGAGRVNRTLVSYGGAIAAGGVLIGICVAQGDKFTAALSAAPLWVLGIAVALQILALGVRTEAWHVCVCAAGGTVPRRRLYRAAGVGYVVMAVNGHLAVAARIAALRRSAPRDSPRVPALISAEVPILALEAVLAAIFSFTLVGPLDLPWWLPLVAFAVTASLTAGLYALARRRRRRVSRGLAVLRSLDGRRRVILLVLVAVGAQIARNWLMLHSTGIPVSLLDSIAVLIAIVTLTQLPVGPSVGAAATVLILGGHGVAAVAAAGVLLTATGIAGALSFAGWALVDRIWGSRRAPAITS